MRLRRAFACMLLLALAACGSQESGNPSVPASGTAGQAGAPTVVASAEATEAAVIATEIASAAAAVSTPELIATTETTAIAPEATNVSTPEPAAVGVGTFTLELQPVASELRQPLHVTHAGDGSNRLFVVEKEGRIRVIADGELRPEPFLDITDVVGSDGSEQGLFAVAFHPEYRTNGRFFVHYTDKRGDTVIARYEVSSDPNTTDPASAVTLLTADQPYANHNGGQIAFGPDGYLYIGLGDGGSGGDPHDNGQSRNTLLGKILRIDVNQEGEQPYGIPADNPIVADAGARPEIWALGLRNPWRFSFDRTTGDLFIADVGQGAFEEVHVERAGTGGGKNYGWNIMEGSSCFEPRRGCEQQGLELPIAEYDHSQGCSITGGMRYRGTGVPAFGSTYFYGDFCSGRIWGLAEEEGGTWRATELLETNASISSFGEDEAGELYLTDLTRGGVYRLAAAP